MIVVMTFGIFVFVCRGRGGVESSFNLIIINLIIGKQIISLTFINGGKSVSNLCREVSGS